jgi:type I restriction enzyme R subunit
VVERALDPKQSRGLIWHTQGSGKTYTMIKAAELLFKANEAQKPTILLMIDRNELEDQMLKNLAAVGLANVAHANSIAALNKLLDENGQDYRGIVVTMIHKFRDMPAKLNTRENIFVLIDEAHRTTGGDLGNFLMAGLPNASYIGFTGTPVDKTAYDKGTFKTFGLEDDKGYLHKYSIAESIEDGTTLPLYYNLAPNEMRVPHDIMEKEFLALAETEGIADIEELNKILDRAINLKNFLKGKDRVKKVAQYVADHYRENVEPLGYKAFLVGVDREACALYKEALDAILPPEYSEIVYTGTNNDPTHLKKWHLEPTREKQIRKSFTKLGEWPKILIVTEKLLTGFDAPILYAMYLDKARNLRLTIAARDAHDIASALLNTQDGGICVSVVWFMALVSLAPAAPAQDLSAYCTPVETFGSVTRLIASNRFGAGDAPLDEVAAPRTGAKNAILASCWSK